MSNTEEFIKKFSQCSVASVVTKFFEEIMVLYNLIGYREDITINTDDSDSIATFIINMNTKDDANMLCNELNGKSFSVYDNFYNINMIVSETSVITTISKALS